MLRSISPLALTLTFACTAASPKGQSPSSFAEGPDATEGSTHQPSAKTVPPLRGPLNELPADWIQLAPWDFESLVGTLKPGHWSTEDRTQLALHLTEEGLGSVHAAVLLAYGGASSAEILLQHLEARHPELERADDAAEVIAAKSLWRFDSPDLRKRLVALCTGPQPHPDLEVRTECAALALSLSQREVIPFLLRVLHSGTPAEADDPIDWIAKKHLTWSKGRASSALSLAAGMDNPFRADASWAHQKAQADILAEALGFKP